MKVDRVILGEETEPRLDDYMVYPDHKMEIHSKDDVWHKVELENGHLNFTEKARETAKTVKAECSCGYTAESENSAKAHLKKFQNRHKAHNMGISETLEGTAIHGFEFRGVDTHSNAIMFQHQELGIGFYATPTILYEGEKGKVGIQLYSSREVFKPLEGQEVHKFEYEGTSLTYKEYLEIVRDFIEDNLVSSRWENKQDTNHRSEWENTHNPDFNLVIKEVEDGEEPFELYEIDGINETLLGRGGNPEIWSKAIHYMGENPLGLTKSYKEVIENSEYDFKGGY